MGEFWGFVDWGAGCLALIVAVVFSFLLGVRTGRIRERNESVRSRIRQNKANMYRYKQQLASYRASRTLGAGTGFSGHPLGGL